MSKIACKIDVCEEPSRSFGWCVSHYQRWKRSGNPLPPPPVPPITRYWEQVDTSAGPDECWPWTGCRDKNGYGVFSTGGKHLLATRWGYANRIGPIPEKHGILHRCDNPPCQNDRHWFTGTQRDNNLDKVSKGRQRNVRGVAHYDAKLNDEKVREIRARYAAGGVTQQELADRYGVSQHAIALVTRRKTWKHVT